MSGDLTILRCKALGLEARDRDNSFDHVSCTVARVSNIETRKTLRIFFSEPCVSSIQMALSILSKYSHQLLSAFGSDIENVVSQFVSKNLISEEVSKEIQQSSEDKAEVLLNAVEKSITTDNNQFEIVLDVLNNVLLLRESNEGCEWVTEMEEEYLKLPPPQKGLRTGGSLPEPESPELEVIRKFWVELISSISSHVFALSDQYFEVGLIAAEAYKKIVLPENLSTYERARSLLFSVRNTISTNSSCYDDLQQQLKKIGDRDIDNLLDEMDKEYSKSRKLTFSADPTSDYTKATESSHLTVSESPEVAILRKFTTELITAISDCIKTMSDLCYTNALIFASEQKEIDESSIGSGDKARKLLVVLRQRIELSENSSALFQRFLLVLGITLPVRSRDKLVSEMRDSYNEQCSMDATSNPEAAPQVHTFDIDTANVLQSLKDSMEIIKRSSMEKNGLKEKLRLKERENERLKDKLKAMEAELERCDSDRAKKEIKDLKLKIKERESEIVQLKRKIKEQEEIIDTHEMKVKQQELVVQEKSRDLAEKFTAAESAKLEMKKRIESLEDEKNRLTSDLETQISNLKDGNRKLEDDKRQLKADLDNLKCNNGKLRRQKQVLETRLTRNGLPSTVLLVEEIVGEDFGLSRFIRAFTSQN